MAQKRKGWQTKTVSNSKNFWKKWEREKTNLSTLKIYIQLCKSWNWPATSIDELRGILKANCGKAEKIVQIDLSYYQDSHKADVVDFKRVKTF